MNGDQAAAQPTEASAPEQIPGKATVSHNEFLEAIKPLLELCGLDSNAMLSYLHITQDTGDSLMVIHAALAAVPADEDPAQKWPRGVHQLDGLKPAPQEFSELYWPVTIRVG